MEFGTSGQGANGECILRVILTILPRFRVSGSGEEGRWGGGAQVILNDYSDLVTLQAGTSSWS
ncbi:hypothetical protein CKO40_18730 [Halochromatium glycolicum]|uniref:Uncharacterized protein n=1 Tax=Halochromatium glycolicum TaxID=85075 RepID=A0AAJ0U8R4_9GAMM|nr:hypothetical protein [Halochromatium glycolicum]